MNWIDKLERKIGKFCIKNLMMYIVALNGFVFFLVSFVNGNLINKLVLVPELVLKGEIWRLVTYIFLPPTYSFIFIIFVLHFYYLVGMSLEHEWGSFRFNVYYFLGMIGTTIGVFITGGYGTGVYLNLSLFLAFARLFPNFEILLFFVIPVKIKYLGWLEWIFIGFTILFFPIPYKVSAAASVINYFVFFGRDIIRNSKNNRNAYYNRKNFKEKIPNIKTFHKCEVCGITEKEDPNMEFRYCSECDGYHEYCMDHLYNHEHIKKDMQ